MLEPMSRWGQARAGAGPSGTTSVLQGSRNPRGRVCRPPAGPARARGGSHRAGTQPSAGPYRRTGKGTGRPAASTLRHPRPARTPSPHPEPAPQNGTPGAHPVPDAVTRTDDKDGLTPWTD